MNPNHTESGQAPDLANSAMNVQASQRSEEELLRSQLITENIPIGLLLYHLEDLADDRTLRMVYANPVVRVLIGIGPENIVGKTLDENFPGLRAKGIPQRYAEVVRSQAAISFEDFTYGDDRVLRASFSVRAFPLPGNYVGIAFENITQRKQVEAAASQSRMLLDAVQRIAHVGGWEWDNERQTMTWTEETYRIHGIQPDELAAGSPEHIARSVACYDPEDRPVVEAAFRRCVEEGVAYDLELRLTRADQQRIWIRTVAEAVKVGDRVVKVIGTIVDITERRRAEEKIRESEKRFRTLTSLAPVGIYMTDASGKCQFANERWLEMAGLSLEEALGDGWKNGLHPDDRNQVFASWQHMVDAKGRWGHEYRFQSPAGKDTWVFGVATAFHDNRGDVVGYVGVNTDITERKQAEENLATINRQLQDSDARYRSLFDESPVAFWEEDFSGLQVYYNSLRGQGVTDLDAYFLSQPDELMKCLGMIKVISVNQATLRMYEAPDAAALLGDLSRVMTPESLVAFREIMVALFSGAQTYSCETTNRTLSGRTIHVLLQTSFLVSTVEERFRALISVTDITERKYADKALREREERYRSLLQSISVGVVVHAPDTSVLYSNSRASQILGLSIDQIRGKAAIDEVWCFVREDGEVLPLEEYPVNQALAANKPLADMVLGIIRPDRVGPTWVRCNAHQDCDVDGNLQQVVVSFSDITNEKCNRIELQRQLAELQQWYEVMLGREERVLELKREADSLRQRLGEPPRYAVELASDLAGNLLDAGEQS